MKFLNIEIKAHCAQPQWVEQQLLKAKADYKGLDHQIDTYFQVPEGRLKLREGNIENALIFYKRPNQKGAKPSLITYHKTAQKADSLKKVLADALSAKVVVDKQRKIFFIGNVKFHIDEVVGLGSFVEIEAIDYEGDIGQEKLQKQCEDYIQYLNIQSEDLITVSYSDLLLNKEK